MSKSTVYHGLYVGGPLDGKSAVSQDSTRIKAVGGFYVHTPAKGPQPASWRWLADKEKTGG